MTQIRARITGTGLSLPSRVVSNADLEKVVSTSDEWIRTRTGIESRRLVDNDKGETLSSLSIASAKIALEKAGRKASDLDLVICCTTTPDTLMPNSSARIIAGLGAEN